MSVDDRTRLNLHRKLEAVLGPEEADTLMAQLPPVTWNQVATKEDLDALRSSLATELRSEMHTMRTGLRSEMETMRVELRTEMHIGLADLRTEMQGLRGDFIEGTTRQIKWLVTFAAAWTSVLVAAVRLIP